jgi:hypothetical protein
MGSSLRQFRRDYKNIRLKNSKTNEVEHDAIFLFVFINLHIIPLWQSCQAIKCQNEVYTKTGLNLWAIGQKRFF